jgi:hypothetical protein
MEKYMASIKFIIAASEAVRFEAGAMDLVRVEGVLLGKAPKLKEATSSRLRGGKQESWGSVCVRVCVWVWGVCVCWRSSPSNCLLNTYHCHLPYLSKDKQPDGTKRSKDDAGVSGNSPPGKAAAHQPRNGRPKRSSRRGSPQEDEEEEEEEPAVDLT